MDGGIEALVDGVLLMMVLVAATGIAGSFAGPPQPHESSFRYAEDVRLALFRTTAWGLNYTLKGEEVPLWNATVEDLLRLEVHLLGAGLDVDFSGANAWLRDLAGRLVRPGWRVGIFGGPVRGDAVLRIPSDDGIPDTFIASGWTYPPLTGEGADVRLVVAVWTSPPR